MPDTEGLLNVRFGRPMRMVDATPKSVLVEAQQLVWLKRRSISGDEAIHQPDRDAERAIPVRINRFGDLVALVRRPPTGLRLDSLLRVEVASRHPSWRRFRESVQRFARCDGGEVYAPLTHPDLRDIPSWTGIERVALVRDAMPSGIASVLDIGAHWGFACEVLERSGYRCTALEVDPINYRFMRRLRRAQRFSFETVLGDVFAFVEERPRHDAVLALAVFHHFLKSQRGHAQLVRLLSRLQAKALFLWAHNPEEVQMRGAYRNYGPEEFAAFVLRHGRFSAYEYIGTVEYRPLLRFIA